MNKQQAADQLVRLYVMRDNARSQLDQCDRDIAAIRNFIAGVEAAEAALAEPRTGGETPETNPE